MAYAFKLERVLVIRRKERDFCATELARAKARVTEIRNYLAKLEEDRVNTEYRLESVKKENRLDQRELYLHSLHCAGLESDVAGAEEELIKANQLAAAAMEALNQAHKALEILERLKEKDFEAWQKEQLRKETVAMDELAVSGFRNKESLK